MRDTGDAGEERRAEHAAGTAAYHAAHERAYGFAKPGDPVEIVNLRVAAFVEMERPDVAPQPVRHAEAAPMPGAGSGSPAGGWSARSSGAATSRRDIGAPGQLLSKSTAPPRCSRRATRRRSTRGEASASVCAPTRAHRSPPDAAAESVPAAGRHTMSGEARAGTPTLDPATLEVLRHRFFAVAEEMGAALVRTAYATNIKDRRDCSCALFTTAGDVIAQAEHIPIHLGVLPWGVRGALRAIPAASLAPGDVVMHNDPFIGGTHTPDIIMFAPVFFKGRLIALVGNLAHHVDVGGKISGSLSPDAEEIFQEGIRFPPVRLRKGGRLDAEILAIHGHNVRTVYESRGDLLAQVAALNVGQARTAEICREFGLEVMAAGIRELADYCDRRMDMEIRDLPAGRYIFEDALEGDGVSPDRVPIAVAVEIGGGRIRCDFTGTARQARGPVNAVRPMTLACIYYAVKALTDPSIPPNEGTYRRIDAVTPPGTLVNAVFPAATGFGNSITCQRIVDVLLGAFAQALPDRVCAAATGSMNALHLGGIHPETGAYYSHIETYGGGYGGCARGDGESGVHTHMTNTRNAPVEVLESVLPVRVHRYGLVEDSEGPGRHRGGFGIVRDMTFLGAEAECVIRTDRVETPPWGLGGGDPARGARFWRIRNGARQALGSKAHVRLRRGDRLVIETSGGGGWGSPLARDPAAVLADVSEGLVSRERAREAYGVVIGADGTVDADATLRERRSRTGPGAPPG
jgi:N-methylhydantoinase B